MKRPSSLIRFERQKTMSLMEASIFIAASVVLALFLFRLSAEAQSYGLGFAGVRVEPNVLLGMVCYITAAVVLINPLQYLYFQNKTIAWGIILVGIVLIPVVGVSRLFSL